MKINFNRICKLAGLSNQSSKQSLNESAVAGDLEEYESSSKHAYEYAMEEEDSESGDTDKDMKEMEKDSDILEVDIGTLMEEIRRAKRLMAESKRKTALKQRRKERVQEKLFENHLKRIVQDEVENILSEIDDRDSSWVYGERKPRRSRKGYSAQGATLPSIGFGRGFKRK